MGFIDFIKNRGGQTLAAEAHSQQQTETAKQMYTREATQEKTAAKSLDQMTAGGKARASEIRDDLQTSIKPARSQESVISSPADSNAAPQALRQNMSNQDKTAPSLSPTSEQMGKPSVEQDKAAPSRTKSQERAQTIARPSPSWER